MAIIMDGKKVSSELMEKYKHEVKNRKIKLAIVLVGEDESSKIYVSMKQKRCAEIGIATQLCKFDSDAKEKEVIDAINMLNNDNEVTGILVQVPLPRHINTEKVLNIISVKKDVDGLTAESFGNLFGNRESIIPCTPKGIIKLLEYYDISLEGKNVCILGRSNIVGRPLGILCLNRNATVTFCHTKTKNLKEHTKNADIIMSAAGVPDLVKEDMVKENVVVIDAGIARVKGKIVGDVDFENLKEHCSYITPVPGGVGPMTIAMLIENLIEIDRKNEK